MALSSWPLGPDAKLMTVLPLVAAMVGLESLWWNGSAVRTPTGAAIAEERSVSPKMQSNKNFSQIDVYMSGWAAMVALESLW